MENLTESVVTQLNYKLDDLNVNDTFRFSVAELLENQMTEPISITCFQLINKLRFYDELILTVPMHPDFQQIWRAIQSRHPPFSSDEKYSLYYTLDFLCTNLQGERMLRLSQGHRDPTPIVQGKIAFRLDKINRELNVHSQSTELTTVVSDILNHVINLFAQTPRETFLNPPTILSKYLTDMNGLTPPQIDLLNRVNLALIQDFTLRRRMLIKRLDVTIQSFLWGERAAGKEDEIIAAIDEQRKFLSEQPTHYQVEDALSAPITLLHEHSKKASGGAGAASVIKKVLIGKVPDRGGRPMAEHRAKAIIAKEGRGGGGRGGGGGGRDDRGQGYGGRGGKGHGGGRGGRNGGSNDANDHERKRKEESKDPGSSKKGRTVTLV